MKKIAQMFKALSDETRLRILALLACGEMCVCDLMAVLDLPQSTVSRHLACLRHAGLVEDRRQGVWMYYHLVEGDDTFSRELRAVLEIHLSASSLAARDREALAAFRAGRTPGRCA